MVSGNKHKPAQCCQVLATTRSRFVTFELRHLQAHACYINFLTPSKINKHMLVVTIRRGHFMNSVFVNAGIYLCAVDAFFLEISTHLCLPQV